MAANILSTDFRHTTLPEKYVRPLSDRPRLSDVSQLEDFPLIDISSTDRPRLVQQIQQACTRLGFFQVINHGVSKSTINEMVSVGHEFFGMSMEEKMKLYSDDPTKTTRLSTSFNVKEEEVNNWRDYLRLHCYPIEKCVHAWPSNPRSFKEVVSKYCREIRELGFTIEELISESLGLEKDYMNKVLGAQVGEQDQHMEVNYYPPCPDPELTYGLPAHTDPHALTILLQDVTVCGLQILIDGHWFAVNPRPDAFVINIGDQLQALSNGIYKSVWHRAITNTDKPRLSVASFMSPANPAVISPAKPLWEDKEGETKPIYRDYTYAEYHKKFWSRNLDQEHCLEDFLNH